MLRNMPLDGITSKILSEELHRELAGARIERIFQPDPYDIYLRLRSDRKNVTLVLSANPSSPRIHMTSDNPDSLKIPLRFCTVLRKYLSGGKILSIDTPEYERIFRIRIQTINEIGDKDVKTLIAEIMGRYSNLILLTESGRIIDAALHVDEKISRVREVLPARAYVPPPPQHKFPPDEAVEKIQTHSFFIPGQSLSLEKHLLEKIAGVSPLFIQEICFLSGIEPKTSAGSLSEIQISRLETVLSAQFEALRARKLRPSLYFLSADARAPFDFHAFSFQMFPYKKEFPTLSDAMEAFYSGRAKSQYLSQRKASLVKSVAQKQALLSRKIDIHRRDLEECRNMEQSRQFGDLILSNLHQIRPGQTELFAADYYQPDSPEIKISLEPTLSGSQNAQKYYKRYNKLKSKFESASRLLEEDLRQLEYYESVCVSLSNVDSVVDIDAVKEELRAWEKHSDASAPVRARAAASAKKKAVKRPPAIPPRRYLSSGGFEILIGRNNLQNDLLTMKTAHKDDLWLHVQKAPGTHAIIRTRRETPPDVTIEEAAMLTAWFSKSSDSAIHTKAAVDYCPVKNVWKPKNSAPGHVLYRDFKTAVVLTEFPKGVRELSEPFTVDDPLRPAGSKQ